VNDNRLIAVLALAIFVPGVIWAVRDYREGHVRLMLFSRRRSTVAVRREDNPRKFWTYTAFNAAICGVVAIFAVLLFFKPVE
jgi:hypothetical protein